MFVLVAMAAISCSPKLSERMVTTVFFDYSKAAAGGIFLSPDSYQGKYTPIGDLSITVIPGVEQATAKPYYDYLNQQYAKYGTTSIVEEEMNPDMLSKIITDEVKKRGGDGYVNFKVSLESVYNSSLGRNSTRYFITGFVIKREEK